MAVRQVINIKKEWMAKEPTSRGESFVFNPDISKMAEIVSNVCNRKISVIE